MVPKLSRGFYPFWILTANLNASEMKVLMALYFALRVRDDFTHRGYCPHPKIVALTQLPMRTVKAATKGLRDKGYLRAEQDLEQWPDGRLIWTIPYFEPADAHRADLQQPGYREVITERDLYWEEVQRLPAWKIPEKFNGVWPNALPLHPGWASKAFWAKAASKWKNDVSWKWAKATKADPKKLDPVDLIMRAGVFHSVVTSEKFCAEKGIKAVKVQSQAGFLLAAMDYLTELKPLPAYLAPFERFIPSVMDPFLFDPDKDQPWVVLHELLRPTIVPDPLPGDPAENTETEPEPQPQPEPDPEPEYTDESGGFVDDLLSDYLAY